MGELGSSGKKRKNSPRSLVKPDKLVGANFDTKMKKLAKNKKEKRAKKEAESVDIVDVYDEKNSGGTSEKKVKKKKRDKESRKDNVSQSKEVADNRQTVVVSTTSDAVNEGKNSAGKSNKKKNKSKKNRRDKEDRKNDGVCENVSLSNEVDQKSGKSKSAPQVENKPTLLDDDDEVYQISSGDEDETTGMKRWITKYHRARPGAEVLLENINDFLVDYWAQKEKEKEKREEEAAEGGWTVVTHVKGRKKTTDAESGTTVGSVATLAVMDKMSKKKDNQVGLDFYRFQKREAQRNEIMMLQSKFEQDKKRIQQMRAGRKFRPY